MPDDRLVQRSVTTDPDGTQHIRYDRTWKGLRVVGGDLVVEKEKGGRIEDVRFNNGKSVAAPTTTTVGHEGDRGVDGPAALGRRRGRDERR